MFKILKYSLLFVALSLCFSCASKRKSNSKKPTTYYPNQRKPKSGKTDNCDCPTTDKRGRPKSNVRHR